MNEKTTRKDDKVEKMTLRGYYNSLPHASYPKTAFINAVVQRCNVSVVTVRNWIRLGMRPSNPEHIRILSEMTGIAKNDLWKD